MKLLISVLLLLSFSMDYLECRVTTYCPKPVLKNGKFRYRLRSKFVKYSCNAGFILYGDRYNNCHHGKWDGPPPKCVRQGCKKVSTPPNGMIYPSHMWSVLHFYCKSGYEVHGPNVTYCDGTSWSSSMPICLPTNTKPSLSCDFEQPDLCGWTHDLNHDFDWRRMQFNTPSGAIGTGPSHDHTLGDGNAGYYMYIESSSRNVNDTARLVSPMYQKTTEDTCFIFYYHMYGSTIGSLRVYLRMINDTSKIEPSKAFFERSGNNGDIWHRAIHLFNGIPNDYQIIIEGVRGNGYVSDIAIDDVSIVPDCNMANYEEQELSTTTESEEYSTTDFLPDDLYSCEGRCDSVGIPMGKHRTCACDENCIDRNECCPDYIDFCLIQGTSDANTETTYTSTPIIIQTTPPISTTITTHATTTTKRTTQTTPITTTQQQTTMSTSTSTTTKQTSRPTTTKISTEATTEERAKQTTRVQKKKTTTQQNEIEIFTEDYGSWEVTTHLSNEIPNYINDFSDIEDMAHLKKNLNEKIVISKLEEEKSSVTPYILVALCVVMAGFVAVVIRKKKAKRSRRFRSGSQGGSASDVRFLTGDEILDLNLDY